MSCITADSRPNGELTAVFFSSVPGIARKPLYNVACMVVL